MLKDCSGEMFFISINVAQTTIHALDSTEQWINANPPSLTARATNLHVSGSATSKSPFFRSETVKCWYLVRVVEVGIVGGILHDGEIVKRWVTPKSWMSASAWTGSSGKPLLNNSLSGRMVVESLI